MLIYNLGLIHQGTKILLLNRERSSWMGCWNGVGGKIEKGETPAESMRREMLEETGLVFKHIRFAGWITWSSVRGDWPGGMYVYTADMREGEEYPTPIATEEGILDWKELEWMLHPDNRGIATNLPIFLKSLTLPESCIHLHGYFEDDQMADSFVRSLDPSLENDEARRSAYLEGFFQQYGCCRAPSLSNL
ncbi:NUDIX hydrolase [Paenibacillus sp. 1001270B_150601_E10]|uniref:NUDIX hydrolase n=1 Tax=Paenibacillus sp. 1001270B_150601_E10 TaxID=2787079 RepID=UPI00189F677F|nr:8-oxo-dGTP diphosphatase [Paenibacillus sp. 1001270B_150601_E10]